jgi:EmrB/QacA subfamily drug resistance transporter
MFSLFPSMSNDRVYSRRWPALFVLSMALVMVVAANTSLTVAVTDIQQKLHAMTSQTRWILDAYPLTVASLLLFFGAAGDRYGRRLGLNLGLVGFGAASVFAALSTTSGEVIAARALMGVSGALIMPATLAFVRVLFPPSERKTALTIWSASSGLAVTVGPLAAGALIGPLGWQAIFWLNVPIAVMLLILSAFTIPASRNESAPRLDVLGALLATAVFAPLTYGIIEGPTYGWLSAHVLGAFAIATIALALFVAWERHVAAPMLDLAWFSHRSFRLGAALLALGFTAMIGIVYISVLFLQQHQLHDALRTGTELLPLGAGILAGAAINGPVVGRFGIRLPVLTGLLMLAAGSAVLAIAHSGYLPVAMSLAVIGLGAGLWLPNLADAVLNGTPLQASGVAGATGDAAVELGSALGIALLGSVLTSGYDSQLRAAISQLPAAAHTAVSDGLLGAHAVATKLAPLQAHRLLSAADSAFDHGLTLAAIVAASVALAAALLAIRMPRHATAAEAETGHIDARAVMDLPAAA